MFKEETYETWSIEKFRRLTERWMEGEHMAPNQDTYNVYHALLVPTAQAFKRLHPRAYANWQAYMMDTYGFTYRG